MPILRIHRSKAGIHIVRRWRGEEISGQRRRRKSVDSKPDVKQKKRDEERKLEEPEVKRRKRRNRRVSQTRQVSLCPSLHSILGRSCSSGAGCLNLGKQLSET